MSLYLLAVSSVHKYLVSCRISGDSVSYIRFIGGHSHGGGSLPCCRCTGGDSVAPLVLPAAQIRNFAPVSRVPARQFGDKFAFFAFTFNL
jgi:hypothetical protein